VQLLSYLLLLTESSYSFNMTTTINKLTGQELLDYVHANPSLTHTEKCKGAGYLKDLADGSQGCNFTEFFEAILDARKANGEYVPPVYPCDDKYVSVSGADWYDSLTDQDRDLYDMIEDRCPEFTKLDAEQCQEFMDELSEHGINTADEFESAYFYQTDAYNAEREFAQYFAEEIACLDVTNDAGMGSFLVIDWQATWDRNLRHDFFTIEFDGETYFFNNNF
jgi:hypothetical protein